MTVSVYHLNQAEHTHTVLANCRAS